MRDSSPLAFLFEICACFLPVGESNVRAFAAVCRVFRACVWHSGLVIVHVRTAVRVVDERVSVPVQLYMCHM